MHLICTSARGFQVTCESALRKHPPIQPPQQGPPHPPYTNSIISTLSLFTVTCTRSRLTPDVLSPCTAHTFYSLMLLMPEAHSPFGRLSKKRSIRKVIQHSSRLSRLPRPQLNNSRQFTKSQSWPHLCSIQ